ncbi:MAG: TonB-dependent receptor plug domain-containing protein [Flavobacteriaceae bacterium]|nr:TonB-dependent receptor plug domain-containing protein [Flavobacteriaceae bacterium]
MGKTYYAKIKAPFASERKLALPKMYKDGVNFKVETDSLSTKIVFHSTLNEPLYLRFLNANKLLLKQMIAPNQRIVRIDTKKFPIGITKIKVTDQDNKTLAERLVFLNAHKQLSIDVTLDKEIYQTREKVNVTITTKDKDNNPIPSNVSVAIADNKLLSFADDKQDHILSYLLLSAELKGKIHQPNFYFNSKEKKSYPALDYVMLTHGWRDYISKSLTIKGAQYKPEQLTTQSGKIVDKKGNPVQATLLLFDQNGNKVLVFESDKNGYFSFKYGKTHNVTLIAYTEDGRQLEIIEKEKIVGHTNNPSTNNAQNENVAKRQPSKFNNPTQQKIKKKATASIALSADNANLDEVVVVAYGSVVKRSLVGASIVTVAAEELNSNEPIGQLLQGRAAGVEIVNGSGVYDSSANIVIRGMSSISGNNQPLVVVDGVPYDQETLSNLNANEVDAVTVLKNAAATALYGSAASNGVIMITTKSQNFYNNWGKKKLNNAKYNNYAIKTFYSNQPANLYYSKQFYIPKYEGKELPKERKDFRQTIYWNPIVETDENGKAAFEFYNSDAITSFQILVEGIGYNGLLGRQKKEYATKKLLNVDFKSPNYMVLNDTINLPITITNETHDAIETTLDIRLPKELKLLQSPKKNVLVKRNSSTIKYIKVKPIKKSEKVVFSISLKSKNLTDFVEREAIILSPYFPTEVSVSGSKSKSFEFSVDNLVAGSLEANFTIYTDVVGDVMDGVEGLIREPYGCFEQVSSSTYPNILVLKYLKETNKSNPEIEKRALDFIKKGYKKLAGYETKKDGFEWYGRTPPHEALTAYGLMEFTEMKEVFEGVSEPMLKRTIAYLLSRRDGKGGFKQNRGKYGFSAAPENVNNAYIVYAISESGIDADIEKEYNATYDEALESNDSYRMALMACASFNFGKVENANELMNKIKENIEAFSFLELPVENTITRSYGNAKNIETVAFSLLALLKENSPDEFLISRGIEYLLGKRRSNRFGSTQSTSMALKALIEYTKTQKAKLLAKDSFIELTINGKSMNRGWSISKNGKIVIENLESYMGEGRQNVTVKFSNTEITLPYSLNINYDSSLPQTSIESPLNLETIIADKVYSVGDNVSMSILIKNKSEKYLGMVTSVIGIPSGTSPQPWQLKKLTEEEKVAYYEIFDNYLVFYWRSFKAKETKTIRLDLKADVSGHYQSPASAVYPYYGDEFKTWVIGSKLKIMK